uniref:Uncharacterized protein n=1 Tax=Strongyloides stercoralis TaxID=6248 RepID=A0AAF5DJY7_STRER
GCLPKIEFAQFFPIVFFDFQLSERGNEEKAGEGERDQEEEGVRRGKGGKRKGKRRRGKREHEKGEGKREREEEKGKKSTKKKRERKKTRKWRKKESERASGF